MPAWGGRGYDCEQVETSSESDVLSKHCEIQCNVFECSGVCYLIEHSFHKYTRFDFFFTEKLVLQ